MRGRGDIHRLNSSLMRFQIDTYSCGPAALHNAMKALGANIPERRIRAFSNTTEKDGTSEHGLAAAAKALGFDTELFVTGKHKQAWLWLTKKLTLGIPVILCISNSQHWATAIGLLGDRVLMFDSGRFAYNLHENGVRVFSRGALFKIWKTVKTQDFTAIAVFKK